MWVGVEGRFCCSGASLWATIPTVRRGCAEGRSDLGLWHFFSTMNGDPLAVQGLRLGASDAGAQAQSPVRELDLTRHSHVPQRRPCIAKSISVFQMNELTLTLPLQGGQLTVFVTNDKNLDLNKN